MHGPRKKKEKFKQHAPARLYYFVLGRNRDGDGERIATDDIACPFVCLRVRTGASLFLLSYSRRPGELDEYALRTESTLDLWVVVYLTTSTGRQAIPIVP